jgi:hypothetical protein
VGRSKGFYILLYISTIYKGGECSVFHLLPVPFVTRLVRPPRRLTEWAKPKQNIPSQRPLKPMHFFPITSLPKYDATNYIAAKTLLQKPRTLITLPTITLPKRPPKFMRHNQNSYPPIFSSSFFRILGSRRGLITLPPVPNRLEYNLLDRYAIITI